MSLKNGERRIFINAFFCTAFEGTPLHLTADSFGGTIDLDLREEYHTSNNFLPRFGQLGSYGTVSSLHDNSHTHETNIFKLSTITNYWCVGVSRANILNSDL